LMRVISEIIEDSIRDIEEILINESKSEEEKKKEIKKIKKDNKYKNIVDVYNKLFYYANSNQDLFRIIFLSTIIYLNIINPIYYEIDGRRKPIKINNANIKIYQYDKINDLYFFNVNLSFKQFSITIINNTEIVKINKILNLLINVDTEELNIIINYDNKEMPLVLPNLNNNRNIQKLTLNIDINYELINLYPPNLSDLKLYFYEREKVINNLPKKLKTFETNYKLTFASGVLPSNLYLLNLEILSINPYKNDEYLYDFNQSINDTSIFPTSLETIILPSSYYLKFVNSHGREWMDELKRYLSTTFTLFQNLKELRIGNFRFNKTTNDFQHIYNPLARLEPPEAVS